MTKTVEINNTIHRIMCFNYRMSSIFMIFVAFYQTIELLTQNICKTKSHTFLQNTKHTLLARHKVTPFCKTQTHILFARDKVTPFCKTQTQTFLKEKNAHTKYMSLPFVYHQPSRANSLIRKL